MHWSWSVHHLHIIQRFALQTPHLSHISAPYICATYGRQSLGPFSPLVQLCALTYMYIVSASWCMIYSSNLCTYTYGCCQLLAWKPGMQELRDYLHNRGWVFVWKPEIISFRVQTSTDNTTAETGMPSQGPCVCVCGRTSTDGYQWVFCAECGATYFRN